MTKGKSVYGIGLNFTPEKDHRGIDDPIVRMIEG